MKSELRNLFHKPKTEPIGGVSFQLYKLGFDQFGDAIEFGEWLGAGKFSIERLREIAKPLSPQRGLLLKLVAGCVKLAPQSADAAATDLTADDVAQMPVPMLAEVVMHVLEENTDFFIQTLPRLTETVVRLGSIGSELLNSLSVQGTTPTASVATPSPK